MRDATAAARERLVDGLVAAGRITSDRVAAAFRAVPRHLFLPELDPVTAYRDEPVPTKWAGGRPISSSSQPAIMAAMLEQLDVRPGDRVLEIGSGTGYNAALLAYLGGTVTTVDIDADTVEAARAHLRSAGADGVQVVRGDGADGWPAGAPYDRIILTAAARDLAPAWLDQLAGGGRLVLPLALRVVQRSVAFERAGDHLESVSVVDCGFMPLRGALAGPDPVHPLGPGLFLELDGPPPAGIRTALDRPGTTTPVPIDPAEARSGVRLWLALHEPSAGELAATAPAAFPAVSAAAGMSRTPVLVGTDGFAAVVPVGADRVGVRAYGPGGAGPADRLLGQLRAWVDAGRPGTAGLRIHACPAGTALPGPTVDRPHTRFAACWDDPA